MKSVGDLPCRPVAPVAGDALTTVTPVKSAPAAVANCHFCGVMRGLETAIVNRGGRIKVCKTCLSNMRNNNAL